MSYEVIFDKKIYFDKDYYILFPDDEFRNKDGDFSEYYKIKKELEYLIPFYNPSNANLIIELQEKIKKINVINNPNIRVMKGKDLIEILKNKNYIPLYDVYFEISNRLILIPLDFFEEINITKLRLEK